VISVNGQDETVDLLQHQIVVGVVISLDIALLAWFTRLLLKGVKRNLKAAKGQTNEEG
jgi:hypothetical protein